MFNARFKSRGRFNNKPKRRVSQFCDVSKFINKPIGEEKTEIFTPVNSFADFQIDERLKRNIAAKGYVSPTPIQDKTMPEILSGKDVVGIANTGTGKTAAFLIPLLDKVLKNQKEKILVVVPTRELAIQINQEMREFSAGLRIFSACCVGGAPIGRQIFDLRRTHNFVIGTPGRLKDLIERHCLNLSQFGTIVLDEADRMLDMGFVQDMRFLVSKMPPVRHTLFFSATVSRDIQDLIKEFLSQPATISVKTGDTAKNIHQDVVRVRQGDAKIEILHDLLRKEEFSKVLIFGRTKHGVERLSETLIKRGFKTESIHGDKNHAKRQKALQSFKNNDVKVLIATDVAARGLDIPSVSHVINYDLPSTYEDYIHRIGRTGRAGNTGKALTFIE